MRSKYLGCKCFPRTYLFRAFCTPSRLHKSLQKGANGIVSLELPAGQTKKVKLNLSPKSTQPSIIFRHSNQSHGKKRCFFFFVLFSQPVIHAKILPIYRGYLFTPPLGGNHTESHQSHCHHPKRRRFFVSGFLISTVAIMDVVNAVSKPGTGDRPSPYVSFPREAPLLFLFQPGTRKDLLDTLKQVLLLIH